jgi:hypothetical protein
LEVGLWATIALLAVGVVLSYVTLRPKAQPAELTAIGDTAPVGDAVPAGTVRTDSPAAL